MQFSTQLPLVNTPSLFRRIFKIFPDSIFRGHTHFEIFDLSKTLIVIVISGMVTASMCSRVLLPHPNMVLLSLPKFWNSQLWSDLNKTTH